MFRRLLAAATALVAVAVTLVAVPAAPATAADNRLFDPGYIISDAIFYDSTTMSASQVQSFLDLVGAACVPNADGTPCLKNYRATTTTRVSDGRCARDYPGASNETAAQIIAKVAQVCGINPQVLLVKLQVEQSLVARTTAAPASTYQKAMGYGCPDTAPCNELYYGFFNQVYSAAAQFQRYRLNPTAYRYRAQTTTYIQYNPNTGCGGSYVTIANQATAGLYNYTPYQPNAAALAAGGGKGDSCSSYGNRNLWRYFSDWFGSPTQRQPTGSVDAVWATGPNSVYVAGWALDPDTVDPVPVHLYLDGTFLAAWTAGQSRSDIGAAFGKGDNHGFAGTVTVPAGTHELCVWALDVTGGPNIRVDCKSVTVVNRAPQASLDTAEGVLGGVHVGGWAYDPDTSASIAVHAYVDGRFGQALTASGPRADVAAAFGVGASHGFDGVVPADPGQHTVCLYAINVPSGGLNTNIPCRTVTVPGTPHRDSTGAVDAIRAVAAQSVYIAGWALDPDTSAPTSVHIYVDGSFAAAWTADQSRSDIAAAFGQGDKHGFAATLTVPTGSHQVCVWALDTNGGANNRIGCSTVTVTNTRPMGSLDAATGVAGGVLVGGWALDPDTTSPISVDAYMDGARVLTFTADGSRPDVGAAFSKGDAHGFNATVPVVAGGPHQVCLTAVNAPISGENTQFACRTVTVPIFTQSDPTGAVDAIRSPAPGTVYVAGWAVDPDTFAPIAVHIYVDGAFGAAWTADQSRADVAAAAGRGDKHGFAASLPVTAGSHQVCVYAIDANGGINMQLGCGTVQVAAA